MNYIVNDIYASIQGEGCLTGVPMVLLRLHGCPVACAFCDTKETWETVPVNEVQSIEKALGATPHYTRASASEVNAYIRLQFPNYQWVLVTGGEPARQDLNELVTALHDGGFQVALETSGTAMGHIGAGFDWVCVSPKFNMAGGFPVLPAVVLAADEIKHVVGAQKDIDRLDTYLAMLGEPVNGTICLQPMSASKKATELCIETCMERGWRLSIQCHKLLALR